MPRDIPVGNGRMLVAFDQHYQIRDLYFPHVGQENHAGGGPCRFGVWSRLVHPNGRADRRKRRVLWSSSGWTIRMGYQRDTLVTDVTMARPDLPVELRCAEVVDFHEPVLVRRVEVFNKSDQPWEGELFHHHDFQMYGTKLGDTAYYDPQLRSLVHYRANRYLMATWFTDAGPHIDQYATGHAGFHGAEGTWRDAEDGHLGGNAIAQGAVDSTMMLRLAIPPRESRVVYLVIGAGLNHRELQALHEFVLREGPQNVIERTQAYWRLWLSASPAELQGGGESGLPDKVGELFKRSLLIVRTQIDNASGAIIAANDSDFLQFSRDTYSYLWPRDGALVAAAMDDAGFPHTARAFYSLCARIISEHGCFFHKYNPDGSLASSWHPWVSLGKPQLPIQEDETALVLWALWRHFLRYRDIEFVRPLWVDLITRAADFLARFRDPDTHLPLPSYDLWEERWGVHAFTVATVYAGLKAAWNFAVCFGDTGRAKAYADAAAEVRAAFEAHLWSVEHARFLRRIVPLDHDRTAGLMADVLAGRTPAPTGDARRAPEAIVGGFERDAVVDSSMYAIWSMGLLDVHDPRVEKTMAAIEQRLWVKTAVGGLARYEGDAFQRVTDAAGAAGARALPGNPWFICTLWLAEWHVARARSEAELRRALPILDWVAAHALPSGVLAEQVHPYTNAPLSVSPLTWSHATVVATVTGYLHKLQRMSACASCGQASPAPAAVARITRAAGSESRTSGRRPSGLGAA